MTQVGGGDTPNEDGIGDRISRAEKKIAANPYDIDAWGTITREAQSKRLDEAEELYEKAVAQFPTTGRYWKIYIEHEMKLRNYEKVEKLFQRCLIKVLNIELWKSYLGYIKETKVNLPSYREKMAQAYDFALEKIGMDIMSYQLWIDYIVFLKSVEAVGSFAENQRISSIRKVYHRGIVTPMQNLEQLWKDYCAFEQGVNQLIAKKMLDEKSKDYLNARRVAREYETIVKGLNKNMPSVPPTNTADELKQVELWKKYIAWERSNPLHTEDVATVMRRVMFAYEQCLLCLGHHPDIWLEAASYLVQSSKTMAEKGDLNASKLFADEASAIYERATTTVLKRNPLVYYVYAEFEESRMKHEKAHSIYKRLLEIPDLDPTLTYVHYMQFARRAEGIKSARNVFKLAREDNRSKYHVFIIAALMEYYCTKDKNVAFKIFDLGLKKFSEFPEYSIAFLDYMAHINEDNNTRVLFERILTTGQIPVDQQLEIWDRFMDFEKNVGDLPSIQKVDKRRLQSLPKDLAENETATLVDRYCYMDLWPCSSVEMRSIGYREHCRKAVASQPVVVDNVKAAPADRAKEDDATKQQYPVPDTSQMLPFKPRPNIPFFAHPVPGGVFPPPPLAADLLTKLPPPESFTGPFVVIDQFIEHMRNLKLPDELWTAENGADFKKMDAGTLYSLEVAAGRKRKAGLGGHDSEDEDGSVAPPASDLYRQRQQKKVK